MGCLWKNDNKLVNTIIKNEFHFSKMQKGNQEGFPVMCEFYNPTSGKEMLVFISLPNHRVQTS